MWLVVQVHPDKPKPFVTRIHVHHPFCEPDFDGYLLEETLVNKQHARYLRE